MGIFLLSKDLKRVNKSHWPFNENKNYQKFTGYFECVE